MDILGKLRKFLIPFIIVAAIFLLVFGSIISVIKDYFVKHKFEVFLALGTALFVVPIIYTCITTWEIPGILIFYDFIFGIGILIMFAGAADNGRYYGNGYNGPQGYNTTPSENRTSGYTNTFYNPLSSEKNRNGGLTDKEVADRKQQIRKKLEKKNILESTREKVTVNE